MSYIRESRKSSLCICAATFLAVFILLPITIAQFFFLFPDDIVEKYPHYQEIVSKNNYIFYDEYIKLCYRWFFPGTIDYRLIVIFIHTVNNLAVILVIASFAIIACTLAKSRSMPKADSISEDNRRRRNRMQNLRIVQRTVISTTSVMLPWLPSMIITTVIDTAGYRSIVENIGQDWGMNLLRANQFLYYIAPCMFPIMAISLDPKISKITEHLRSRLCQGTQVGTPHPSTPATNTTIILRSPLKQPMPPRQLSLAVDNTPGTDTFTFSVV